MQLSQPAFLKKELSAIFFIAIPIAFAQLCQMAMGVTDTILLGKVDKETLAIGGFTTQLFFTVCVVLQSALSSAAILIAEYIGSRRISQISKIYWTTYIFGLILCIPCYFLLKSTNFILMWTGENPDMIAKSSHFMDILLWGMPPVLVGTGLIRVVLPAFNASKILLQITPLTTIINALLNAAFIYGLWGAPKMGLYGSAIGSTITLWVSTILFIGVTHCKKNLKQYLYPFKIDLSLLLPLMRLGLPICISSAAEMLLFLATSFRAGLLGTDALAAHQIANSFATFTFMIPLAISQAANVRVSYWVGAQKPLYAKNSGFLSIGLGSVFMGLIGIIIFIFPKTIVSLFIDIHSVSNQSTIEIAIVILKIVALFQIVDGMQGVAMGALRGLKDTTIPMIFALISYWVIGYTLSGWFAFSLNYKAPGLWTGMAIGLAVIAVLATARFYYLTYRPSRIMERALR